MSITIKPSEELMRMAELRMLAIELCRELYDRFMMGGWEPQDAHSHVEGWLARFGEQIVRECREIAEHEGDTITADAILRKFGLED